MLTRGTSLAPFTIVPSQISAGNVLAGLPVDAEFQSLPHACEHPSQVHVLVGSPPENAFGSHPSARPGDLARQHLHRVPIAASDVLRVERTVADPIVVDQSRPFRALSATVVEK